VTILADFRIPWFHDDQYSAGNGLDRECRDSTEDEVNVDSSEPPLILDKNFHPALGFGRFLVPAYVMYEEFCVVSCIHHVSRSTLPIFAAMCRFGMHLMKNHIKNEKNFTSDGNFRHLFSSGS
jgi:hypothetical protein